MTFNFEYLNVLVKGEFHHISIFNEETGKHVDYADTEQEAREKIERLERGNNGSAEGSIFV